MGQRSTLLVCRECCCEIVRGEGLRPAGKVTAYTLFCTQCGKDAVFTPVGSSAHRGGKKPPPRRAPFITGRCPACGVRVAAEPLVIGTMYGHTVTPRLLKCASCVQNNE